VNDARRTGAWRPTHAHVRAVVVAASVLVVAIVVQRSDLLVLAVPFLGAALWGWLDRPQRRPSADVALDHTTLFEGQWTAARVTVRGGPDDIGPPTPAATGDIVTVVAATSRWMQPEPPSGTVVVPGDGDEVAASIAVRARRWGRHEVGLERVVCTSRLGAYRSEIAGRMIDVTTLPLSAEFDAADVVPLPAGLVGLHRANRQGSGSEPAEVRPFRTGDRLRRINWKVSSRTGELHVTSTWADRDTHVLLLLDTDIDLGASGGVDGRSSSFDIAVRAAAAIAQHYLRTGDRVGLLDLGRRVRDIRAGSGRRHLRRVLDALVVAEPSPAHNADLLRVRPVEAGAMVIAFSPLVGQHGRAHVANLAQHGHVVIVVDTLPPDPPPAPSPWTAMAQRVRTMERQADIDQLAEIGVPVVRWRGPGTLDEVLRNASRLAGAPRLR
jgi:uncharacterized protein (DUF58 family)